MALRWRTAGMMEAANGFRRLENLQAPANLRPALTAYSKRVEDNLVPGIGLQIIMIPRGQTIVSRSISFDLWTRKMVILGNGFVDPREVTISSGVGNREHIGYAGVVSIRCGRSIAFECAWTDGMIIARPASVAIIGGGIGGLTAAVLLLRAGFDVQVYEQARALGEIGAGIRIGPNASRILYRLGIAEVLERTGVKPLTFDQRRWDDGRILLRSPLGETVATAFGAPYYTFLRADIHRTVADAIPQARVHLAHRFTRMVDHGDRIEAHFENGTSVLADALIGADGIHSVVRHALFGPDKPRFTGCVAYRGLVPANRLKHLGLELRNQIWMGPGQHFVHYFVSAGKLVNFVAVIEEDTWLRESWVDRAEVANVLAAYAGWHTQVLSIIGSADEIYKWALFDRAPLPRWSLGRVTLLGDSCHPMLPFMGEGASQAIEDAATLKECVLKFPDDVPAALRLYAQLRLPRASRLQAMSENNKTRFHMPDGPSQRERDAQMASGATDWSFAAIAWLYEHDAEVVDSDLVGRGLGIAERS
jgi:salicylate hydroxylase